MSKNALALRVATLGTVAAVFALFTYATATLIAYPWDWGPDDGLAIASGYRAAAAGITSLYSFSVVPTPDSYGPVLPALIATGIRCGISGLLVSRILSVAWTLLAAAAVFALVARAGSRAMAWLAAAALLAPFQEAVWLLLVRPDGLALALWLWSAVVLLPERLEPASAPGSWRRAIGGSVLLVLAVLTKPTSVVIGAPIVLCLWRVDRRRAMRVTTAAAALGLGALALLQGATHGAYLYQVLLWTRHGHVEGQPAMLLAAFARRLVPLLVLTVAVVGLAVAQGRRPWRDAGAVLVASGLLTIPLSAKAGASSNYFLPLLAGIVVFTFRLASALRRDLPAHSAWAPFAEVVPAFAILLLLSAQRVHLPGPADAATAEEFYGLVSRATRKTHAPLLALTPDYAYVVAGQADEVLWPVLIYLRQSHVLGADLVFARLSAAAYGVVVIQPQYWPNDPAWHAALGRGYALAATCRLGYYYGDMVPYYVMVRRPDQVPLPAIAHARCEAPAAAN